MKKKILLSFLCQIFIVMSFAQLTAEQRIEDSVIGWWSNNKYDHLKPQSAPVEKKKENHVNKMLEWMKKTYTPVAGLGTSSRYIDKGGYGVLCYVWNVSHDKQWTEPNGNFKPIPEENTPFWIAANRIFGSYTIPFLKKENEYFFTMQPDGYGFADQVKALGKNADPRIHPNAHKYLTWINEWQTVYLTPNNKLPFTAITKGELLQRAEEALDKQMAAELKDVQAKWPNDKKGQDAAMVYRKENIDKYRTNIQKLKERYKNSLNEPAVIRDMQPTMYSFQLDPDIFQIGKFEKELNHFYQVYKVDAELYTKMQSDVPQWVAVAFPFETKENGNQRYELHTALSQNFNYDYVYNYFFDPEKVKGIAYKPANEEQLLARLNEYRKKNAAAIRPVANPITASSGAFFSDDFSSSPEGGDPANWFFRKFGKHSTISTVKNQTGKWLQLGYGTPVNPSLLKKPLPENFTLDFDMNTDGGFTSRTGGAVTLTLNTRSATADGVEREGGDGSRVSVEIISGNERDYDNNNYMGMLRVRLHSTPEVNKQNYADGLVYEYALREFTNNKTRVHVSVGIKNNIVTVGINNKPVAVSSNFKMIYGAACISCGVPAGSRFNTIFWNNTTTDADNIKVYISNIKITKE